MRNLGVLRALRLGGRSVVRRPVSSLVAVGTLAVGLGAILSVVALTNALFFRPLPAVAAPEQLVRLIQHGAASWPNFRDLAAASEELVGLAAFSDHLLEVDVGGEPRKVLGLVVSEGYFDVLAVEPRLGRLPGRDLQGVVVSHRLWTRELGASERVLERQIRVHGVGLPVIAVAPEGFIGTFRGFQVDLWLSEASARLVLPSFDLQERSLDRIEVVGRLASESTVPRAKAEIEALGERLRRDYPSSNRTYRATVVPLTGWDEELRRPLLGMVAILLVLGTLVLLVAIANVTGILLARLEERRRELAVHAALGASRGSMAALTLGEPLILSLAGAATGFGLAALAGRLWPLLAPPLPIPISLELGVDQRVAVLGLGVALFTGLLAGAPGALRAWRTDPEGALRTRRGVGASGSRLRRLLIVVQVAFSVLLLLVASLCVRAIEQALEADLGFTVDGVAVATAVDLTPVGLDPDATTARFAETVERLRNDPLIAAAGASASVPLLAASRTEVRPTSQEDAGAVSAVISSVDRGYFPTLEIPILQGRSFDSGDDSSRDAVAVVDERLARELWPDRDPLGRRLWIGDDDFGVVGVAGSLLRPGGRAGGFTVYLPLSQSPAQRVHIYVRGDQPAAMSDRLRSEIQRLTPGGAPPTITSLSDLLAIVLLPQRVAGWTAAVLGIVAVILAAVGLHALMALLVTQRRNELALRMALGAMPRELFRDIAIKGFGLTLLGLATGLAVGMGVIGFLGGFLLGVGSFDPGSLAVPVLVVTLATLSAIWLPARRAAGVDPMVALREE